LREFAEDAGLSTALVVDRSGSLVAGISSETDVTIEVISALVAGASGAMRALVAQLGETGSMESLHFGQGRLVYLREIINRFILVGVSDGSRPAGLVRQRAQSVKEELSTLLENVNAVETEVARPAPSPGVRSLREVAMERAALRGVPADLTGISEFPEDPGIVPGEAEEPPPALESSAPEPREVLEPLDFGESEIVIEPRQGAAGKLLSGRDLAAFSPFEADEELEDDDNVGVELSASGSIFELADDDDDETDEDEDEENQRFDLDSEEVGESAPHGSGILPGNVFEMDEFDTELDEDTEDIGGEINEMIDEEDQESEVRSSGPFYF